MILHVTDAKYLENYRSEHMNKEEIIEYLTSNKKNSGKNTV